jgi:hypothetical protein
MKPNKPEDLWKYVNVCKSYECWPFMGHCERGGYGRFKISGKKYITHRLAYELVYGQFDKTLYVCHICDNPPCCNPFHLYLGTAKDNAQDRNEKGRHADISGAASWLSKLDTDTVIDIRMQYNALSIAALSRKYNVSYNTIRRIVRGETFKNAGGPKTHRSISKLSIEEVTAIKELLSVGIHKKTIAVWFEVDPTSITNIATGKTWDANG